MASAEKKLAKQEKFNRGALFAWVVLVGLGLMGCTPADKAIATSDPTSTPKLAYYIDELPPTTPIPTPNATFDADTFLLIQCLNKAGKDVDSKISLRRGSTLSLTIDVIIKSLGEGKFEFTHLNGTAPEWAPNIYQITTQNKRHHWYMTPSKNDLPIYTDFFLTKFCDPLS